MRDLSECRNLPGKLTRSSIVDAIIQGKIKKQDIRSISDLPEVKILYIGKTFNKRDDEIHWDEDYLLTLSAQAVATVFNEEYMLHLADVVRHLNCAQTRTHKSHQSLIAFFAVLIILMGGIALSLAYYAGSHQSNIDSGAIDRNNTLNTESYTREGN